MSFFRKPNVFLKNINRNKFVRLRETKSAVIPLIALVIFTLLCIQFYSFELSKIPKQNLQPHTESPRKYLRTDFSHLLTLNSQNNLFLLEPYIMNKMLGYKEDEQEEFFWRFNLNRNVFTNWNNRSLTVGIFASRFKNLKISDSFKEIYRVSGSAGPFTNTGLNNSVVHVFYETRYSTQQEKLYLHLIVLYHVKHFLWIGSNLSHEQLFEENFYLNPKHEHIFDSFNLGTIDGISVPDDIAHLLSQLPTSRYLHCPVEKTVKWFKENNLEMNQAKIESTQFGIVSMKSLMRKMQMEFWIACGTLLGWYRQCHPTPYTSDTDFATWGKYVQKRDLTRILRAESRRHRMYMWSRYGERHHTMEYSFHTKRWWNREQLDLFFIYPNDTHFLMPEHLEPEYSYQVYLKYELCSVELLGYKLLAPCEPEKVIEVEYGPKWNEPVKRWLFFDSPANMGPLRMFNFNVTQHDEFSPIWELINFWNN